eukprot:TRINITY_DN91820_c0_g1_i1.p1 TRINITY_DN91820_c0_g1~~TRINITY_DN91820_c0_g1_i1.p1  ORF type:complete len:385 (+),score=61.50 TRINITY_DN91820_c0_g1_i1:63-1217(+)
MNESTKGKNSSADVAPSSHHPICWIAIACCAALSMVLVGQLLRSKSTGAAHGLLPVQPLLLLQNQHGNHNDGAAIREVTSTLFIQFKASAAGRRKKQSFLQTDRGRNRHRCTTHTHIKMPLTAFVVRTVHPMQAMAERILSWFEDLKEASEVELWVSTNGDDARLSNLTNALEEADFRMVRKHHYTDTDMKHMYPALEFGHYLEGYQSLAYQYHVQAVDVWWQALAEPRPDHVWILEDDVGYSGDISDLLGSYANTAADFLTGFQDEDAAHIIKVAPQHGWHDACPTSGWLARVPPTERRAAREHVQRHSKALLNKLHDWSLRGEIDMSEAMPGTVCILENLTVGFLQKGSIGEEFAWDTRISQEQWQELLDSCEGKLFHALKF